MYVENLDEVLSIMVSSLNNYEEVHYVADACTTMLLLQSIAASTNFIPESITFDVENEEMYYYTTLSIDEDGITYLVYDALNTDGDFYGMMGLIFVDEDVPEYFEEFITEMEHITEDPIRVMFNTDDQCYGNCESCIHNKSDNQEVNIDLDDETDQILGFNIDWEENGDSYSFSYHSNDEDSVLDMMEMFNIE